jgi:opacity protein-like surface antigen
MKKVVLGVLVALIAASPAVAAKKSKKEAVPAKIDSNEASWRLVKGSLPIYLPAWSMPFYMAAQTPQKKK